MAHDLLRTQLSGWAAYRCGGDTAPHVMQPGAFPRPLQPKEYCTMLLLKGVQTTDSDVSMEAIKHGSAGVGPAPPSSGHSQPGFELFAKWIPAAGAPASSVAGTAYDPSVVANASADIKVGSLAIVANRDTVREVLRFTSVTVDDHPVTRIVIESIKRRRSAYERQMRELLMGLAAQETAGYRPSLSSQPQAQPSNQPAQSAEAMEAPASQSSTGSIGERNDFVPLDAAEVRTPLPLVQAMLRVAEVTLVLNTECEHLRLSSEAQSRRERPQPSKMQRPPAQHADVIASLQTVEAQAQRSLDAVVFAERSEGLVRDRRMMYAEKLVSGEPVSVPLEARTVLAAERYLDFGHGRPNLAALEAPEGVVIGSSYVYRGPLAVLRVTDVFLAAQVREALTAVSLQVGGLSLHDTSTPPRVTADGYGRLGRSGSMRCVRTIVSAGVPPFTSHHTHRLAYRLETPDEHIEQSVAALALPHGYRLAGRGAASGHHASLWSAVQPSLITTDMPHMRHRHGNVLNSSAETLHSLRATSFFTLDALLASQGLPCGAEVQLAVKGVCAVALGPTIGNILAYVSSGPLAAPAGASATSAQAAATSQAQSQQAAAHQEQQAPLIAQQPQRQVAPVPLLPLVYLSVSDVTAAVPLHALSEQHVALRLSDLTISNLVKPDGSDADVSRLQVSGLLGYGSAESRPHLGSAVDYGSLFNASSSLPPVSSSRAAADSFNAEAISRATGQVLIALTDVTAEVHHCFGQKPPPGPASQQATPPVVASETLLSLEAMTFSAELPLLYEQPVILAKVGSAHQKTPMSQQDGVTKPVIVAINIAPIRVTASQLHASFFTRLAAENFGQMQTGAMSLLSDGAVAIIPPASPLVEASMKSAATKGASDSASSTGARAGAHAAKAATLPAQPARTSGSNRSASSSGVGAGVDASEGAPTAGSTPVPQAEGAPAAASETAPELMRLTFSLEQLSVLLLRGVNGIPTEGFNATFDAALSTVSSIAQNKAASTSSEIGAPTSAPATGGHQASVIASLSPLAALQVSTFDVAATVDARLAAAVQVVLTSVTFDDVRPPGETPVHPSLRRLLYVEPLDGQLPLRIGAYFGPVVGASATESTPSDGRASPSPAINVPAMELVGLASSDAHPLSRLAPPQSLLLVDLSLRGVSIIASPIIMALVGWATAPPEGADVSSIDPLRLTRAQKALERLALTSSAFPSPSADVNKPAPPSPEPLAAGVVMAGEGAGAGACLAPPSQWLVIRVKAVVDQPAIFLVRDVTRERSDALALTASVTAWADVSSVGELGVSADVTSVRGMRVAAAYSSNSSSSRHHRASSTGRPQHLRIPAVTEADYLRPYDLHAYFSMRPALMLPTPPVPTPVPSLMSVRLCSVHSLILRVGYQDAMLVMDAVQGITADPSAHRPQKAVKPPVVAPEAVEGGPLSPGDKSPSQQPAAQQLPPQLPPLPSTSLQGDATEAPDDFFDDVIDAPRTVVTPSAPAPVSSDALITDPTKLALQASIALPMVVLQLTNDVSGMDLPLMQLTVEDTRLSVLSFHVGGRLLADAGATIAADYYNPQRALWEPLLERWSAKLRVMKPEPLQASLCTGAAGHSVDGTSASAIRHLHWMRGVGSDTAAASAGEDGVLSDVKMLDAFSMYEIEDSVAGTVPMRVADGLGGSERDRPLSEADAVAASDVGREHPHRHTLGGAFMHVIGKDAQVHAEDRARHMQQQLGLERVPFSAPPGYRLPGLDVDSLPSDMLIRVLAKKPLNINVSHAAINLFLDTAAMFMATAAASAEERGLRKTVEGGLVYIMNSTDVSAVYCDDEEKRRHAARERSRRAGLDGEHEAARELGVFPVTAWTGPGATLQDPHRQLLLGPQWSGAAVASAVLLYSARKDNWFRGFAAVFRSMLVIWDVVPTPPAPGAPPHLNRLDAKGVPRWASQSCLRSFDLTQRDVRLVSECSSAMIRPPSAYIIELQRMTSPAATGAASGSARSVEDWAQRQLLPLPLPLVTMCLGNFDDYSTWGKALLSAGIISALPGHAHDSGNAGKISSQQQQLARDEALQPTSGPAAGSGIGTGAYFRSALASGAKAEASMATGPASLPELHVTAAAAIGPSLVAANEAMSTALRFLPQQEQQQQPGLVGRSVSGGSFSGSLPSGSPQPPSISPLNSTGPATGGGGTGASTGTGPTRQRLGLSTAGFAVMAFGIAQHAFDHSVPPDSRVRTSVEATSQEGNSAVRTLRRSAYEIHLKAALARQGRGRAPRGLPLPGNLEAAWSGSGRPEVTFSLPARTSLGALTSPAGCDTSPGTGATGAANASGGQGRRFTVPVDKASVHFLPGANPFAVVDPVALVGSATAGMGAGIREARSSSTGTASTAFGRKQVTVKADSAAHRLGQGVVAEVRYVDGVKMLQLRSTVQVLNTVSVPLLVQFETAGGKIVARRRLGPGQHLYAPLEAAASGYVRFAPMLSGYERISTPSSGGAGASSLPGAAGRGPAVTSAAELLSWLADQDRSRSEDEVDSRRTRLQYGAGTALPIPLDTSVPLSAFTPYALSAPISLVDASADGAYHHKKSLLSTVLTGPDTVPLTSMGSAIPLSCGAPLPSYAPVQQQAAVAPQEAGIVLEEPQAVPLTPSAATQVVGGLPMPPAIAPTGAPADSAQPLQQRGQLLDVLPVFHCAAHVTRPPAGRFRRKEKSFLSGVPGLGAGVDFMTGGGEGGDQTGQQLQPSDLGVSSEAGGQETVGADDGLELRPSARGFITQEHKGVDLSSTGPANDRFTTVIALLPCLRLENILPFPISLRLRSMPDAEAGREGSNTKGASASAALDVPLLETRLLPAEQQDVLFTAPSHPGFNAAGTSSTGRASGGSSSLNRVLVEMRIDAPGYSDLGWSLLDAGTSGGGGGGDSGSVLYGLEAAAERARGRMSKIRFDPLAPYLEEATTTGTSVGATAPTQLELIEEEQAEGEEAAAAAAEEDVEAAGGRGRTPSVARSVTTEPPPAAAGGGGSSRRKARRTRVSPLYLNIERNFVGTQSGSSGDAAGGFLEKFASGGDDAGEGMLDADTIDIIQARLRAVSTHVRIIAPYLIVNRTDLPLIYGTRKQHRLVAGSAATRSALVSSAGTAASAFPSTVARQPLVTATTAPVTASESAGTVATHAGTQYGQTSIARPADVSGHITGQPGTQQPQNEKADSVPDAPEVSIELFAFSPDEEASDHSICVKSLDPSSRWSDPVGIDQLGAAQACNVIHRGELSQLAPRVFPPWVRDPQVQRLMELAMGAQGKLEAELTYGVQVELAPGRFSKSRVVTVEPSIYLINQSGLEVAWRQELSDDIHSPIGPVYWLPAAVPPPKLEATSTAALTASSSATTPPRAQPQLNGLNKTTGASDKFTWMPVHWPVRNGPKRLQLQLVGPGKYGSWLDMSQLALTGAGTGPSVDSLVEGGLACASGAASAGGGSAVSGLQQPAWSWTTPFELDDGELCVSHAIFCLERLTAGAIPCAVIFIRYFDFHV